MNRVLRPDQPSCYHVISRICEGERWLGETQREWMRLLLGRVAEFCGVEVLTYAILSNHFHLLIRVPEETRRISDVELLRRVRVLYGPEAAEVLREELASDSGSASKEKYLSRMHSLPTFMKMLKHRFTARYNRESHGFGTVWSGKYRSLLVESKSGSLRRVAAYIDLNPVRAGLCDDPSKYRHCGYSEAVAGSAKARAGLQFALGAPDWETAEDEYRISLLALGTCTKADAASIPPSALAEALRLRVRHFSQGVALGSPQFVESVFELERDQFPPSRKTGARPFPGGEAGPFGGLRTLRRLGAQPSVR